MLSKIIHISDFYYPQVLGGGEINNQELISMIEKEHEPVSCLRSFEVNISFLKTNVDSFFIVSNFIGLPEQCREFLALNCKYVIYEHDHKYLLNRNPAMFKDFKAPDAEIVNRKFYKSAKKVFCQSSFHKGIVYKNLGIDNLVNLSGNIWSLDSLDILGKLSKKEKNDRYSIMLSDNWHKNTSESRFYCEKKGYDYDLIASKNYLHFLSLLSNNKKFLFLPKTPETLSRVVVEAKMMGVSVITNRNVGATYEDWYSKQGQELVDHMLSKREEIVNIVMRERNG